MTDDEKSAFRERIEELVEIYGVQSFIYLWIALEGEDKATINSGLLTPKQWSDEKDAEFTAFACHKLMGDFAPRPERAAIKSRRNLQ
jgi:hypothetical protein